MKNNEITVGFDSSMAESVCDAIQVKIDTLGKLVATCLKAKQHEAVKTINTEIKSFMKIKESIEDQAASNGDPIRPYKDDEKDEDE